MKKLVALLILSLAFATAPAFADFQEGYDAYYKGDYKTALREWQPLVEQRDAKVQYFLGEMHYLGWGVLQDYKTAVKWYTLSAEQGHAKAQATLGLLYERGYGVVQDYARAHMWYNIGASNGNDFAIENRGYIAKNMTLSQIEEAQGLARACVAKNYKGC